jgi:AcrR family transcriptional regulator
MTFVEGAPVDAAPGAGVGSPLADRAVRRAIAAREAVAREEVTRLLDAGLQVMRDVGHGAPRVADIVTAAGLSNQAFYRHFSSRDELVAAVIEAGALRLVGYLGHLVEKVPADDPSGRIRAWIEGVLSQAARPTVAADTRAVMWNGRQLPRRPGEATQIPGLVELLLAPIAELGSPDPESDAAAIVDVVFGRLDHFLWVSPPTEGDIERVVGFCLRAVGA